MAIKSEKGSEPKKKKINWKKFLRWTGLCLAILVVLLILAAPIYYYWNDFHNNNRSNNPSDWGMFGDFFGGVLNPIISLLTLIVTIVIAWQLKKIEEKNSEKAISATYQPQLVLEKSAFYTYASKRYALKKPTEFSFERKGSDYESDLISPNLFSVDVYNIGFGAAKNIEFIFVVEVDHILKLINDMSQDIPQDKRIEVTLNNSTHIEYLSIEYPKYMRMSAPDLFLNISPVKLTHMLNVATLDKPYQLGLPRYYLELYTIFLYTFNEMIVAGKGETKDFPPLILKAKYFDIGIKPFEKIFKISLQVVHGWSLEFLNALAVEEIQITSP